MSSPTPERNANSRVPRSPSPSPLPPPPSSAKLPPRPSTTTTSHVAYSRQSLGPGGPPLSANLNGTYNLGTGSLGGPGSRNFSSPSGELRNGSRNSMGRPVSEILAGGGFGGLGGGKGGNDGKASEAEAIDQWFQDLASYEVTLEEMAAASLDQNFTEELSAIEQWFRVLSEAERTAALYSLLQHSTQVQIRFFMTVLQQMSGLDPMSAMLSPAGGGMQAQMDAKIASLNMRSPNSRTSLANVPASASRDSFGGGNLDSASYLTPESALANEGLGGTNRKTSGSTKANNRISAPGTLASANSLGGSAWGNVGQLDQVLERGPSPSGESISSARSNGGSRPKSMDFSGSNVNVPGSAGASVRSPRQSTQHEQEASYPRSPGQGANWASMVNTPASPMFSNNGSSVQDQFSPSVNSVPKLSDAPKRRSSARVSLGADNGALYNKDGELVIPGQSSIQQQQAKLGRGLQSPGSVGGGFQGAGNGAWARSPSLGNDGNGGFGNATANFGLGVGGGGSLQNLGNYNSNGLGSPSPNDLAFQMSQLQLQQLQLQQLQQLQQLGVGNGGIGMGLPSMAGLGMGALGGMGGGSVSGSFGGLSGGMGMSTPRSASMRSASGVSQRTPMMGGGRVSMGNKSAASPGGRRESSGVGAVEEDTDIRVLEDIPQWLRTLRLHKYTPNFEGSKWRDMVVMTDADLEDKGVAALGARRKLLKTFESVRSQMGIADPTPVAAGGTKDSGDEQ